MSSIKSLCVFCGSSKNPYQVYQDAAVQLGQLIAKNSIKMVYGGGKSGLMGIAATACLEAGGHVTGVMTEILMGYEGSPDTLNDLIILPTMHERKKKMFDMSDAFVVLPGGLGTLDETFELLTWRQVGLHGKPIVFINTNNYWNPLLDVLIPHMIKENFVRSADQQLFSTVERVEDVLTLLEREPYDNKDFVSKWG